MHQNEEGRGGIIYRSRLSGESYAKWLLISDSLKRFEPLLFDFLA